MTYKYIYECVVLWLEVACEEEIVDSNSNSHIAAKNTATCTEISVHKTVPSTLFFLFFLTFNKCTAKKYLIKTVLLMFFFL